MAPFLEAPTEPLLVRHLYVKAGTTVIAAVRMSSERVQWALSAMERARQAQAIFPGCRGITYDLETEDAGALDLLHAIGAHPRYDDYGEDWPPWLPSEELAVAAESLTDGLVDLSGLRDHLPEDVVHDRVIEVTPDSIEIRIRVWEETDLSSSWSSQRATWLRMACRYASEEELPARFMELLAASPEQAREFALLGGRIQGEEGRPMHDPYALVDRAQLGRTWQRLAARAPTEAIKFLFDSTSDALAAAIPARAFLPAWYEASALSLIWALDAIPRIPERLRQWIRPAERANLWREYLVHPCRRDWYAAEFLETLGPEGMACLDPVELRPLLESHEAAVRTRTIALLGQVGPRARGQRAAALR